jgi:hypothetical protein
MTAACRITGEIDEDMHHVWRIKATNRIRF